MPKLYHKRLTMAWEDKVRWNKKHAENKMPTTPIDLVVRYAPQAPKGRALDIACGNGRHAKYLASFGFDVDAVDISDVAIERLQGMERINAKEVDLDTWNIPEDTYTLIVKVYYLNRRLFPQIKRALKPGGLFIAETFVEHPDNEREPSNPAFRLKEGELKAAFEDFEILHYEEYWDNDYLGFKTKKVALVARKPTA